MCSAASFASDKFHCVIAFFAERADEGLTLNSSSPYEMSSGVSRGSAADSPHIPAGILASVSYTHLGKTKLKKPMVAAILCLGAMVFNFFQFSKLVQYVYGLFGAAGLCLLVCIILDGIRILKIKMKK